MTRDPERTKKTVVRSTLKIRRIIMRKIETIIIQKAEEAVVEVETIEIGIETGKGAVAGMVLTPGEAQQTEIETETWTEIEEIVMTTLVAIAGAIVVIEKSVRRKNEAGMAPAISTERETETGIEIERETEGVEIGT